ncbi:MAG: alpha/beta hydrolase [Bauldia litoralis]
MPRIHVPSHIVWADDDKILPLDYARAYERLIPGSKLTVIEDCGHLMHVEKPDVFADTVATFIAGAGA